MTRTFDEAIDAVVRSGNCSGCGMCASLDDGLRMRLDPSGWIRPVREAPPSTPRLDAVQRFDAACPGRRVSAQRPARATSHPTMGPIIALYEAWAVDPDIRWRGSSGGTLTALAGWLLETGQTAVVVGAKASPTAPTRTVSLELRSRTDALGMAGSRYAPTAGAALSGSLGGDDTLIGKPCEASAVRALRTDEGTETPLLLSFFCAGTPSQLATDDLIRRLGMPASTEVTDLWYRGRGWPGDFTAVGADGTTVATDYETSWGRHLGRQLQWRCKICPDGVGESADIAAADFWRTDDKGYPQFSDSVGISALMARTPRGKDIIDRAVAAGVIEIRPIDPDALAAIQPLQRERRELLAARLLGQRSAGGDVPRYTGFGLVRRSLRQPRQAWRAFRGARRRYRAETGP